MISIPTDDAERFRHRPGAVVDFDFDAVDSPESLALDELINMAGKLSPDLPMTMNHARVVLAWAATQGIGPSLPVLELAALWIGGSIDGQDVPLRAAIFIREFAPHARHAHSLRRLATYHGASKQMISKLARALRGALALPSNRLSGGVAQHQQADPPSKGIY